MVPESEHKSNPGDSFLGAVVDGRYRLIGRLLTRERGAVYRAVEDPVGLEVALRVVIHGNKDEAREEDRFRREADLLVRLRNLGIVGLLAYGTSQGLHWAAYELVRAESLAQGLQRGPLAWNQALGLTQHLLAGLDAAHRIGFLHGELTPANILIIQEQAGLRARLAGLGANRMFGLELPGGVNRPGNEFLLRPGTIEYLAPEQIDGKHLGPWSDIYALGAVLYHMLAGVPAVAGADASSILNAHMQGQIARLEPAYPCPVAVVDMVSRALARAPGQRFPDARSMYEEISNINSTPQHQMLPGTLSGQRGAGASAPPPARIPQATAPRSTPEFEISAVKPPPTRILERVGDSAIEISTVRPLAPPQRPSPSLVPGPNAGNTQDIDLDEVQIEDVVPDSSRPSRLGMSEGIRTGNRAAGTMDLDPGELQEIVPEPQRNRGGREPVGLSRPGGAAFGGKPGPVLAKGPVLAGTGEVESHRPPLGSTEPPRGDGGGPFRGGGRTQEPAAPPQGPLKAPPPDAPGIMDPEKATVMVDVDQMELARLQQEYASGAPAPSVSPRQPARGGLPLPLPALIGVAMLALALFVVVVVVGVHFIRSQRTEVVQPPLADSEALKFFSGLTKQEENLALVDEEPLEAPTDTPKSLAEWRTQAEQRVKEIQQRDTEVSRQILGMIQHTPQLIGQVQAKDRARAHQLARELVGFSTTRRHLGGEVNHLKTSLRRADEEKLKGIVANAATLLNSLMEVSGYAQGVFDELKELAEERLAETTPPEQPPVVAEPAAPISSAPLPTVAQVQPTTTSSGGFREVSSTPSAGRPTTPPVQDRSASTIVLPASAPPPTRSQPSDPEVAALIASVTSKPSQPIEPAPSGRTGSVSTLSTPVTTSAASQPSNAAGSETFTPIGSSPSKSTIRSAPTKGSTETDEALLLRILGSQREGPIVVTSEPCPCDPRNVEAAARAGGKGLTECELKACEKVPPGTHHYSDINLNLASYFFQQKNLRREFEALYRATSYGSYKHDPNVLSAYIKVAVRLKRFQIALQAKDRFLFVQDSLPPDQRRPRVAEIYKVLAQAFEHQFYRQKERKPKGNDFTYLNRAIDFWERYADYSGQRGQAETTIAELKRLRHELEQEQ